MISILGAGKVGSGVAFLAAQSGLDDIILVDRSKNKAMGEAFDIVNSIPEKSMISVTSTDEISKIKNSDVVIVTVSVGTIKDERIDLLPSNVPIISEVCKSLRKYADNAKIIVVTNPVDLITYQIVKQTEFPREKIIGMGSSLDSSRLRYLLARELGVKQGEIEGIVIGEHGPTMVPIFSHAKSESQRIELPETKVSELTFELRNYWRYLISFKGASVFGAAKNAYDMAESIVKDRELSVPGSVYLNGEYGFSDASIGVPLVLGRQGVKRIVQLSLNQFETDLLQSSFQKISNGISKLLSIVR